MARRGMKSKRTAGKRKGGYRKRRVMRRARDVADYAGCSVKRTIRTTAYPDGNFRTNDMYEMRNTDLGSFDRAVAIAKAYQHFRIKKITLTLKPIFDTYQEGVNATRPNLYYMIDKSGSIPDNPTLEQLKQMGAKAHRWDEKPFSISWRPSVLDAAQQAAGVVGAAQYKISPWLSTSSTPLGAVFVPSNIDHLGVFWFVEQLFGGAQQYNAEVEVQFQFKKPLWIASTPNVAPKAKQVAVAEIDDSADGIVGGPDSNNIPRG